jgi:general stress protein YciG
MGGPDTPENLVEVTVTQHAMFHFCNYQLWGNEEDQIAWKGLSGQIDVDEIKLELQVLGGKKGGKKGGKTTYEKGIGIFRMSPEEKSEASRKGGKIRGQYDKENGTGFFNMTTEEKSEASRKGGKKTFENGTGVHAMSFEEKSAVGKKAAETNRKNGTALYGMSLEKRIEAGRKGGRKGGKKSIKITNAQRWQCTKTGYVSTPAGLSTYQKARGIDTSNRIRIQ